MRAIAFINQKGGVGKTTTAVNVAAGLCRAGRRVMLIDLDPQAHATLHLGVELSSGESSVYDVITRAAPVAEVARYCDERLTILPASIDLVAAEIELAGRAQRERVLASALEAHRAHYDVMAMDCAPSLGLLTVNALAAADEVIIPLQPHFFGLQGLAKLLETIALVRAHVNPSLRVTGVVLCMYERGTKLAQEVTSDIERFLATTDPQDAWHGARLLEARISRNIKLAEAPSFGKSIFEYAPDSRGAADYAALAQEIDALAPATGVVASASATAQDVEMPARDAAETAQSLTP
jgi:chromosome partitioning protein